MLSVLSQPARRYRHTVTAERPLCSINLSKASGGSESIEDMLAWLFMPLLGVSTYRELTACCLNQNDIAAGTQIVQILSDLPQALDPSPLASKARNSSDLRPSRFGGNVPSENTAMSKRFGPSPSNFDPREFREPIFEMLN